MPWATVADFVKSETYAKVKAMHGWTNSKLSKFVAAFGEVFSRAKRNGASDSQAEDSAFGIAFSVAKRAASEETMSKAKKEVHYFAAFAPHMRERLESGVEVNASEYKFTLVEKSLPMLKSLVSGLAFNYNHNGAEEMGVIRDIIRRSEAPAEVQKATDSAVPFLFVASYRDDASSHIVAEERISPEWLVLDGNEVLPMTFAATHDPLNDKDLGIKRVAASHLFDDAEKPVNTVVVTGTNPMTSTANTATITVDSTTANTNGTSANVAAVTAAKVLEPAQRFDKPKETPPMPDEATNPIVQFEAKIASLNAELESEKKARKAAEVQASAYRIEFETTKRVIEELKSAAIDHAAETAAMTLLQEGKVTGDQVAYFAGLYKDMGREKFEVLAASLPKSTLGAYAVKAANAPAASPEAVKAQKERYARLLSEG